MGMRATTVRFSEELWKMLEREADEQGITTAQLLREAAIMRVAALATRRGDDQFQVPMTDLVERRRKLKTEQPEAGDIGDPDRLAALRGTGLLEDRSDPGFERLAEAARQVLNAPVALVTLIDADRQVFLSQAGLKEPWASRGETPLAYSFCADTAVCRTPRTVHDARLDPQCSENPAIEEMDVVAYVGVPLITRDGHALGALCVCDDTPRIWTSDQVELLETFAAATMDRIQALKAGSQPSDGELPKSVRTRVSG
jgi:hypothetical protein